MICNGSRTICKLRNVSEPIAIKCVKNVRILKELFEIVKNYYFLLSQVYLLKIGQ